MRIYINEHGVKVGIKNGKPIVEKGDRCLNLIPFELIDSLLVGSTVQITSAALIGLSQKGVGVFWVNSENKIVCCLSCDEAGQVCKRKAQYDLMDNERFRTGLSRRIVSAKIHNQRILLEKLNEKPQYASVKEVIRSLTSGEKKCISAKISTLRGIEGIMSRNYFSAIAVFIDEKFAFSGRNRRPPRDRANAALSYSYLLLYNYVDTVLRERGFDTFVGVMHTPHNGHRALASDVMEISRSCVSDLVVLEFLKNADADADFTANEDAIYLSALGRRKVIAGFENRLSAKTGTPDGYKNDISGAILFQADKLSAAIENKKASEFQTFREEYEV